MGQQGTKYKAHWDVAEWIKKMTLDKLKGSLLVQTGSKDWSVQAADSLRMKLLNDCQGLYIAYDARAFPVPTWLSSQYTMETDPSYVDNPYYIELSTLDSSVSPAAPIKLDLWRRNTVPKSGEAVVVPGNSYGSPGWKSVTKGTPAMYLILVQPKTQTSTACTGGTYQYSYTVQTCLAKNDASDVKAAARAAAECKTQVKTDMQCRSITCTQNSTCLYSTTGQALTWPTKAFRRSSEIQFTSPSKADMIVQGKKYSTSVSGKLDFQYLSDSHHLQLNNLTLYAQAFKSDVGEFKDIVILLYTSTQAECKDAMPVYAQPCTRYQIPVGKMETVENLSIGGKSVSMFSKNLKAVDVTINHTTKGFIVQGTSQATIQVDGKNVPVQMDLDLRGYFLNFAPVAKGIESTRFAECEEGSNQTPVTLSAAGSFDIYTPVASNLPRYEWYEDFGQPTQYLWGKTDTVTISPHMLGYGVHTMILLVGDNGGQVADDTLDVEVGDTTAPEFTSLPQDVSASGPPGTQSVYVDIGTLDARDACGDPVMVTNNAPASLLFPAGVTQVTCTSDDQRGNTPTAVQKVTVVVLAAFPIAKVLLAGAVFAVLGAVALPCSERSD